LAPFSAKLAVSQKGEQLMSQPILPLIPSGANKVGELLSIVRENEYTKYYMGVFQIGIHKTSDKATFKAKICELIFCGLCRNKDVLKTFPVSSSSLKRWMRQYKEKGADSFHAASATRGGAVLTDAVIIVAQDLLDKHRTRKQVAGELSVNYDVIRKAVADGRLVMPDKTAGSLSRSERSLADSNCDGGVACERSLERTLAALGKLNGAPSEFQNINDVENGGVLCALPALTGNGLYAYIDNKIAFTPAYYDTIHIVSLLAFMTLFGVPVVERLRFESPGELGKLLGLDRIPEVKTLRGKLSAICHDHAAVVEWTEQLTRHWFNSDPDRAGVLYVDGHVSVYHGGKTKLPRRYVTRSRLCMRGSTFYYVNDVMGQPFFAVEKVVDEGLLKTLRNSIVPRLLREVPKQPSERELDEDDNLHRFILIFDREGYSPAFFREMWKEHRIACATYHKYPKEPWPEKEFIDVEAVNLDGEEVSMKLAERGTYIGERDKGTWVKEIRKLNDSGHQTSIITTMFKLDMGLIAIYMFNRWVQENFFKYMMYFFNIDALVEHGTTVFSDPCKLINPAWKRLDYAINSIRQKTRYRMAKVAQMELFSDKTKSVTEKNIRKKADLCEEVEQFQKEMEKLVLERKKHKKHISFEELPDELKFERLKPTRRLFYDTIKMLVYRAETGMANSVKPFLERNDDSKALIRQLSKSHADIHADKRGNILNVRVHRFSTKRHDEAIRKLLRMLNETKTLYPGTNMELRYSLIGENDAISQ
jgi:prepilin-type processing-associated H-X9-DG protein